MYIIHHSKDLDGWSSGAILKSKYPNAQLMGWDYKDPVPNFNLFHNKKVIMVDISFPIEKCVELALVAKELIIIDHHISFKKEVDKYTETNKLPFKYIYEDGIAACEIAWKYVRSGPPALPILLLGRYDTWRKNEGDWDNETLPFQLYMRTICNDATNFPEEFLTSRGVLYLDKSIEIGKAILKYQEKADENLTRNLAFTRLAFKGLTALCVNTFAFSSDTVKSIYDPIIYDVMIGFNFNGKKWSVSLRSTKEEVNVSEIAKARGGGGHAQAAGFEVDNYEDIFK